MRLIMYIAIGLIFGFLFPINSNAQTVIYSNIIMESETDTIFGELVVYKHLDDSTYLMKSKKFRNQSMVSLDPGTYKMCYYFNDRSFIDNIVIHDDESAIIINILENPMSLMNFDFSKVIQPTVGIINMMMERKNIVYMEF